ncbi:low molecular weight protein tyrosine phosphatase family protein [Dyella sp. BiH032]|uniref:low molecular weight protein tyrosine phosphatase family protein n=1 Tax=Dyella sp. BiH032 TaxID=3075430 RepID=UPI002892C681|nr:low molecular weight protein tyrosine phosphatase family protein [Dyella sp. BiH032]WNL46278.1 low molecular weight protein tyrosine phosphatase family protein [Dyella sp. BiH032]
MTARRVLFLCSRHRLRSPTAEQVFHAWPGLEVDSAGLAPDADTPLSADQVAWAELILVMENAHRRRLQSRFAGPLKGKRVVVLGIPDDYGFMQPELVDLLLRKAGPLLR